MHSLKVLEFKQVQVVLLATAMLCCLPMFQVTCLGATSMMGHDFSRPCVRFYHTCLHCLPVSGHFSWRNNYDGSWFIQALCQVLDTHALEGMELQHMMTLVNKAVAFDFESSTDRDYSTGMKQMPSMVSMLTKFVYFKQKA